MDEPAPVVILDAETGRAEFSTDDRIALLDRINLLEREVAFRDLIIEQARVLLAPLP